MSTTAPSTARERMLRAAYLTQPPEILGLTMRPFTGGILELCFELELKLFIGDEEDRKAMSYREQNRELMAILFLLAQPEDVVLEAIKDRAAFWSDWVVRFGLSVDLAELDKVAEYVVRISQQTEAAATRVVDKPEPEGAKPVNPPGN